VTTQFRTGKPAEDVLCSDKAYREIYNQAGLDVLAVYAPLGEPDEGVAWVTETDLAPWVIYVLARG
jgi:hypothetical protein